MSLISCKECGKQISSEAAACPNCGAKPKRKTSLLTWLVTGLLVLIVISAITRDPSPPTTSAPTATKPARTADEIAFENAQLYGRGAVTALRKAMRNPESFSLASAIFMAESKTLCMEYRAQNGFGGMNVEKAVVTGAGEIYPESSPKFASSWRKHCAGRTGQDIARFID